VKLTHYYEPTRKATSVYDSLPKVLAEYVMNELDRESGDFHEYKTFRSPDETILMIRKEGDLFNGELRVHGLMRRFPVAAEVIRFSDAPRGAFLVLAERFFRSLDFLQLN